MIGIDFVLGGLFELLHPLADSLHQFRNLSSPKKDDQNNGNHDDLSCAYQSHQAKKGGIHSCETEVNLGPQIAVVKGQLPRFKMVNPRDRRHSKNNPASRRG